VPLERFYALGGEQHGCVEVLPGGRLDSTALVYLCGTNGAVRFRARSLRSLLTLWFAFRFGD
jgi:hypothetical protein